MPETEEAPFALLERSDLFAFLLDLIQRVYRPSIQSAVTDYGLVIVGGQSLTLWARQYLIDEMTGDDVGFVTSDDLDFIGNPQSIDYCERVMGVPFRKARMDDNTINIAAAYIDWIDGKEIIVDILEMDSVGGAPKKEIFKYLSVLEIEGVRVAVIDPITCLKSRLSNLFAYWQERPHRESVRVKIALRASNHYLRDLLVHEGYRAISEHIRRIKALALTRLGKRVYVEYGIDVLDAIPHDPAMLPTKYLDREQPNMLRQIGDARQRKLRQYQHFACGPIHQSHFQTATSDDPR
ncbi:hypothetical protein [Pseudomonas asplenii]|uniref:Nucleotidyl transferase AbiEii toxin, Type IV TA system n=1 Tax=Pseudomonas asplenii TaxID=53407 RepID=A0A1H6MRJ0_9PSED|nr:hypothetical protein [Pseudomonas fuscovaginae]SEI02084.1 hypothetical protein SAMN05216581_1299 [Pseudomonas fuscovaginae]